MFTALQNDGSCGSSTACPANGGQQPTFLNGNAGGTYNIFKGYTGINNKPYIAPSDTNAADSMIDCDLSTQSCGANLMPLSPGQLTATDKANIDTWVTCGSPQN